MSIAPYLREIGRGRDGARSLDARAGPRPDEPGARPPGDRSRDRRLRRRDAHQGRIGGRADRLPRRRARALHRHPQRRRDDRAALVQRLAQDSQPHRAAGRAAGAAGLARPRARPGSRRRTRDHGRDLSRPRPGLRRQLPATSKTRGAAASPPSSAPKRFVRRWRAFSTCAASSACATPATRSPSCSSAVAAARCCASINYTHPEYGTRLAEFIAQSGADAMLMRGTEGEPVADARRLQKLDVYLGGAHRPELSLRRAGRCRHRNAGAAAHQRRADHGQLHPGHSQRRDAGTAGDRCAGRVSVARAWGARTIECSRSAGLNAAA